MADGIPAEVVSLRARLQDVEAKLAREREECGNWREGFSALRAQLAEARAQERERLLAAVPGNWCDPLLTGPDAVLPQKRYSYSPTDIERLLNAIRDRIRALSPTPNQEKKE